MQKNVYLMSYIVIADGQVKCLVKSCLSVQSENSPLKIKSTGENSIKAKSKKNKAKLSPRNLTSQFNNALTYSLSNKKDIRFQERVISAENNDCGFKCLGYGRQDALKILRDLSDSSNFRKLVAPEIMEAMVKNDGLPPQIRDNNDYKRYFTTYKEASHFIGRDSEKDDAYINEVGRAYLRQEEAVNKIQELSETQDIFLSFISHALTPDKMLSYSQSEGSTGIIDALAYLKGNSLEIYQADEDNKLEKVHSYIFTPEALTLKLLHTYANREDPTTLNHFNLLEIIRQEDGKASTPSTSK